MIWASLLPVRQVFADWRSPVMSGVIAVTTSVWAEVEDDEPTLLVPVTVTSSVEPWSEFCTV